MNKLQRTATRMLLLAMALLEIAAVAAELPIQLPSGTANLCDVHPELSEYVNGKLLAESKGGIVAWRREGGRPRGGNVWAGFHDEFRGSKVTIAVSNFPMNNWSDDRFIPARAPLSVWLEEMKIPPLE